VKYWRDLNKAEKKVTLQWKLKKMSKEKNGFKDSALIADRACVELGNAFYPEKGDDVIMLKRNGNKMKITECTQ